MLSGKDAPPPENVTLLLPKKDGGSKNGHDGHTKVEQPEEEDANDFLMVQCGAPRKYL